MNKLVLSTRKVCSCNLEVLEIEKEDTELVIEGNVEIDSILFPSEEFHSVFRITKNSSLKIYMAQEIEDVHGKIEIISEDDTSLVFHLGVEAKGKNHLEIENQVIGNRCLNHLCMRIATSKNASMYFKATGIICKDTKENEYLEDIKYLNEYPGSIVCLPELLVESDDTLANHNMTVAGIDEENLFYLESRNIKEERAKELIRKSFVESMARKDGEVL